MKIVTIGDIHGNTCWERLRANAHDYDKIIFVGDYLDGIGGTKELINLREIIRFKATHHEKVVLLLGNHDLQYMYFPYHLCSGYQADVQYDATNEFQTHRHLFQVAFELTDKGNQTYLWTHAGVTQKFYDSLVREVRLYQEHNAVPQSLPLYEHAALFNILNDTIMRQKLHACGESRGGQVKWGGITWEDKSITSQHMLSGVHQIVGHSRVNKIVTVVNTLLDASITYVDCLDKTESFYELEINA